jgi:hypothetical protein
MAKQNAREVRMEELFEAAHKDPHSTFSVKIRNTSICSN